MGSSDRSSTKQLLIYWIAYSLFTCIEYFGYELFNLLLIAIDCLRCCVSCSRIFYWLAKCIGFIWFLNSGSHIVRRFLDQNGGNDSANTDMRVDDDQLLNGTEKCK